MIRKHIALTISVTLMSIAAMAQSLPLSVKESTDTSKALVFYISGDGGFNKFSKSLMESFNKAGHPVLGLDSKDYFWKKKKPEDAAKAIEATITKYNKDWKRKKVVLIGYSFGADVAPFMLTRFSGALSSVTSHLVLLSPSATTDFEIHLMDMFGSSKSSGVSVPAEVNKVTSHPVLIVTGESESDFPFEKLTISNKQTVKLPGGHHYNDNIAELSKQVLSRIK